MGHSSTESCIAVAVVIILSSLSQSASQGATPPDVVWYVGAGGSSDITTCGRNLEAPCDSLQTILDQSPLFGNETFTCYLSGGDGDGRTSTTVNFLPGTNFVPPACLMGWSNLAIIGLGPPGSVNITSNLSGARAVFNFEQCSNVSITNLLFQTAFTGRVTLFFYNSSDVSIRNSTFPLTLPHSGGILIDQCSGSILIENCEIYGNPEFIDTPNSETALQIRQGRDSSTSIEELPAFTAVIKDCVFHDIVSGGEPDDSYRSSHNDAIVIEINFLGGAVDNKVIIQGCSFYRIVNSRTSGVLVNYDYRSVNNSVLFMDSTFLNNVVRYGGGIASYFYGSAQNSFLGVADCSFTDNTANFEGGGVFVAFLSEDVSNAVGISSSTFTGNRARFGAGVFLFNNPSWTSTLNYRSDAVALPLVMVNITDCEFEQNEALLLTEGTVNALRIILTVDGTSNFVRGTGSGLVLRSSLAYIRGTITFARNLAITGGGISVQDRSRLDMTGVVSAVFAYNNATFSGGAIYADESSTSITADEYNHTLAQNRFGLCFALFGNEFNTQPTPARITFDGNMASEGDSINAYSLRACRVSNFIPAVVSTFLALQSDGTVVYENIASNLTSTSTGPSYLFFYGSSTRCYKAVGDITYLLPNCSHSLLTETFYLLPAMQCGLEAFEREFSALYGPGAALRPTIDKLITPWAGIETTWTQEPQTIRQGCPESNVGELYLSPAPGEQFDLTVQLADQLLNYVSSTIFVEIERNLTSIPGVLIQLNGIQYSYTDRVYFTPNRALSGIALVGLPGTEGRLRIIADSQIRGQKITLLIPFKLAQCPLGYYSPLGAATIEEVNELLVGEFALTVRTPNDNPLACSCFDSPNLTVSFPDRLLEANHRCISGYTVQLNSILWAGYIPIRESHATLSDHPSRVPCPAIPDDAMPVRDDLTVWIMETRASETRTNPIAFDPVDVVPYDGVVAPGGGAPVKCFRGSNVSELVAFNEMADSEFSIELCTRGYCRGDIRDDWYLVDDDYPCVEHREGPLCGQCKPGFALTLYSTRCRDCSNPPTAAPVVLTLGLGLLFVVVVVGLNRGATPTVDSMLFFIQAVAIIVSGRTDYESFQYLAFFNVDFTFNLCITSTLDGLGRLAGQYVTPVYLLLLLCIVLLLTRIKGLSKYLGKHSFLQALWLVVLIIFLNIATVTFEIIHCRTVGPLNGTREFVLVDDPSVNCYEGKHLPFAIIAIVLAVFVILPFPFYTIFMMYIPKVKPITDVYCSYYKDEYRAWVWFSLERRLILVLLGVFIQDTFYRHFYLIIGCVVILVIYVVTWPYKSRIDNHYGFFVTWLLVILATVTQPDIYIYFDPSRVPSWLITWIVIFIGAVLIVLETVLRFRGTTVGKFYEEKIFPHYEGLKEMAAERMKIVRKRSDSEQELEESTSIIPRASTVDATMFREPLLDSDFSGSEYSTSINASSRSTDRRGRQKRLELQRQERERERERERREREEEKEKERESSRPTMSVVSSSAGGDSDGGFAIMSTYTEVI